MHIKLGLLPAAKPTSFLENSEVVQFLVGPGRTAKPLERKGDKSQYPAVFEPMTFDAVLQPLPKKKLIVLS